MKKNIKISAIIIIIISVTYFSITTLQSHSNDFSKNTIQDTIETISSKKFMGRLVGTKGNEKTIEYITKYYEDIDLEKYDDDYYFENTVTIQPPEQQVHNLEVIFKDGTNKIYEYGRDYIDAPTLDEVNIELKITFNTEEEDTNNKILVLEENTHKPENKACFIRVNTLDKVLSLVQSPTVKITDNLYQDLKDKDVDYVKLHTLYGNTKVKTNSVIGKISGTNSSKALVISAHLDHVGWAGDTVFYGAADNASGVSAILELAKNLKYRSESEPFDMDIIIAAFNAEESGCQCSYDFAPTIAEQYDDIYNINIDTIGKTDGGKLSTNIPSRYEYIDKQLLQTASNCFNNNNLELINEYYGSSDHMNFLYNNIPAVSIGQIDVLGENNNTAIHTEYDTIEHIDYNEIEKITDTVFDFIVENDGISFKPEITFNDTIMTLASPEFMGRLPGTEGNEKTVKFIADFFKDIDLEPYDDDYYHETTQTVFDPNEITTNLEVTFQDNTSKTYEYGKDYIDYPSTISTDINSSITFDKDDTDITNKILVLNEKDTYDWTNCKAKTILQETDCIVRVTELSKEPTNYIQISKALYEDLKNKYVDSIRLQLKYNPKQANIKNVIGKIKGIDSRKAVVISAHLDHVGWANDTVFCGALDNASGIATILELAKRLQLHSEEQPFKTDIIIAAFNGEDSLLSCNENFIIDMINKYEDFYNLNIDTVGKSDGGALCINSTYQNSDINALIEDFLYKFFDVRRIPIVNEDYGESNHNLFNKYDIPAVTLSQKNLYGENGTMRIHTMEDTIDMINYSQIEEIISVLYDFITVTEGYILQ